MGWESGWARVRGGWVEGLCCVGGCGGEARGVAWGACHCDGLVVCGDVGVRGEPPGEVGGYFLGCPGDFRSCLGLA